MVAAVAIFAALPSTYFLYDAGREAQEQKRITSFVQSEIAGPGRAAEWEHRHRDDPERLRVFVMGHPIEPVRGESLSTMRSRYGLEHLKLVLVQSDISARDSRQFQSEVQRDLLRAVSAGIAARDSAAREREERDSPADRQGGAGAGLGLPQDPGGDLCPRLNLLLPDTTASAAGFLVRFGPRVDCTSRDDILKRAGVLLNSRLGREVRVEER